MGNHYISMRFACVTIEFKTSNGIKLFTKKQSLSRHKIGIGLVSGSNSLFLR